MTPRLLTFLTALMLAVPLAGQTAREELAADRNKAGGVYCMYPAPHCFDCSKPLPPPEGYVPFYISHFGRHGARYNLKNPDSLRDLLDKAAAEGKLTERGREVHARYTALYPQLKLRDGDLSPAGAAQQEGLAIRMLAHYPQVFRDGTTVRAVSSISPRCLLSMAAFLRGLRSGSFQPDVTMDTGGSVMCTVAPHTHYNELRTLQRSKVRDEDRAAWLADIQSLREEIDTKAFLDRLFTDNAWVCDQGNPYTLMEEFYFLAASMPCTGIEEDFYDLFTPEELYREWQVDNFKYYGYFGPSNYFGGTNWAIAAPSLEQMVADADEDIRTGTTAARLRFGHDVGLMCLYTLMGLDGWRETADVPREAADAWRSYRIPMAGNLQWIFFRGKEGDVLVRVLLNESPAGLPVEPAAPGYYRWEDVRAYCLARCAEARRMIEQMP